MRNLPSLILLILGFAASLTAQNPHGANLRIDCASCHTSAGWEIDAASWATSGQPQGNGPERFQHGKTGFELKGGHAKVDCQTCHESLVFSNTGSECITCHVDIHQQTVGADCSRCHTPANWLVDNITELHQQNGFPLLGRHAAARCEDCHHSETALRFDRIGNDCIDCHREQYLATTMPNHQVQGFPTDCFVCHDVASAAWLWTTGGANHLFFPLTQGHQISDCAQCHTGGVYAGTPKDCFACHESDYRATTNPDHETANFPTDCTVCHGTDVGWPAKDYKQHDQTYFPIFSGRHDGVWNQCTECHTTAGDYKAFSCVDCHEHNNAGKLASKHDEVSGYSFNSSACYSCHPKGN